MIKGNKGEWSELYVLLYLLGVGKLYAADENVEKIENIYFPILKIMRSESERKIDYCIKSEAKIVIEINGSEVCTMPADEFKKEAESLYKSILAGGDRAFEINSTEDFMRRINAYRLAAPSSDKTDITMQVHDPATGYEPIMGFSIKSELGNAPTLLNASGATNFVYEVKGLTRDQIDEINAIETRTKILDRIQTIKSYGGSIKYKATANETFGMNLMLVDSMMEDIIGEMLLHSYESNTTSCEELMADLDKRNPLGFPREGFYTYKFKKLLAAIALGMKPSALWDGLDEANGGYIIVNSTGDVLAYHLYNRNFFEDYLLKNTKLERASTSRHGYASLYEEDGHVYINLNLQIRFK